MSLTLTKVINNSEGSRDGMGAARRQRAQLRYDVLVCVCLAEFRPAPGFCTCQTRKLTMLEKKL